MFKRRSTAKPNDQLIANFKSEYGSSLVTASRAPAQHHGGTSLTDALDVATHFPPRNFEGADDLKDTDPTPRGHLDTLTTFSPSILDTSSHSFNTFANQLGYYTPTPGGTSTLYHSQAGDLHTPGFNLGLGTPLSMPNSEGTLHAPQVSNQHIHGFHAPPAPHAPTIAPHLFQNPEPFGINPQHTFAPHHFYNQPSAFDPISHAIEDSPIEHMQSDVDMQDHSPLMSYRTQDFGAIPRSTGPEDALQDFRWHINLNAPTAMTRTADEIPLTYLNKGQAYSLKIKDAAPEQACAIPNRYRTYVRVSFEEPALREKPGACWQLWKEGRGTNEAHQRGGRLQAVEFVESTQTGAADIPGRPKVQLESASFDGFAVTWTPVPNQHPECSIAVRFNFLSTDFSHSKGVKGIPVRLCAKTEVINTQLAQPIHDGSSNAEVSYCQVKLFRDHGAERKLTNDSAHARKMIEKLQQQLSQVQAGIKEPGKRKRSGSVVKPAVSHKPGKVERPKRKWSASGGPEYERGAVEEDLKEKIEAHKEMCNSMKPSSIFHLKGEELDDPDLHPVSLGGDQPELTKTGSNMTTDSTFWEKQSIDESLSGVSPSPSSMSIGSDGRRTSNLQKPATLNPPARMTSNEWRNLPGETATGDMVASVVAQPGLEDYARTISRIDSSGHTMDYIIEAKDIDPTYQPPPKRTIKPVACYYVNPRKIGKPPKDAYYRAVYIMQHTIEDLVKGIAVKCDVEPTQVVKIIRKCTSPTSKELHILLDDNDVREIPEGQDMIAEFQELEPHSPSKREREREAGTTDVQVDGDVSTISNVTTTGYELWLTY